MTDDVIVQGTAVSGDDPERLRAALDDAFDYRGDVTVVRRDGTEISGFLFDRRGERVFDSSVVRILPPDSDDRVEVGYPDIAEVRFSGKDAAAGRSWENWVRRYAEKKLAGEEASIESERLDCLESAASPACDSSWSIRASCSSMTARARSNTSTPVTWAIASRRPPFSSLERTRSASRSVSRAATISWLRSAINASTRRRAGDSVAPASRSDGIVSIVGNPGSRLAMVT